MDNNYPETAEDIEMIEGAEFDALEDALELEEEAAEQEISGLGNIAAIGRIKRFRKKSRASRSKRKKSRTKSARRSYTAGRKAATTPATLKNNLTSRGEMMMRLSALPATVLADLKAGKLQMVDQVLFAVKDIDNQSQIDMFQASDDKKIGLTNLNRAMLPNGEYFLLSAIVVEYAEGIAATANDAAVEDPSLYNFGQNSLPAEIINGTIEMTQGSKIVLPEMSCGVFDDNDSTKRSYLYRLNNPKLLKPGVEITPAINLVRAVKDGIHAPAVKISLVGTSIVKA